MDKEKKNPLISFIVPVYNLEEYIETSINCIVNSLKEYMELIIVDDGSADNSLKKINNICKGHDNIKIYSKSNGGVSSARNFGIEKATGKYISFIDGDDTVDLNIITNNIDVFMQNTDFIVFGFKIYNEKKQEIYTYDDFKGTLIEDLINFSIKTGKLNSCWAKFFLRKTIKNNEVKFPINVKIGEDRIFVLSFLNVCNSFQIVNGIFYEYRIRKGSAMSSTDVSRFKDIECLYYEIIRSCPTDLAYKVIFDNICSTIFFISHSLSMKEVREVLRYIYSSRIKCIFIGSKLGDGIEKKVVYFLMKNNSIICASVFLKLRGIILDFVRQI